MLEMLLLEYSEVGDINFSQDEALGDEN